MAVVSLLHEVDSGLFAKWKQEQHKQSPYHDHPQTNKNNKANIV
jgi:hypothetical protein